MLNRLLPLPLTSRETRQRILCLCRDQAVAMVLVAFSVLSTPAAATDRITPPNRRVPRYVSVAYDEVYARANHGHEERLKWIYRAQGLPVQVVAETHGWRRICDPDGDLSWVASHNLAPQRTVMNLANRPLALRRHGEIGATINAYMASRAIGRLLECKASWCRVSVGSAQGWAPIDLLWGTRPAPQCGLAFPSPRR